MRSCRTSRQLEGMNFNVYDDDVVVAAAVVDDNDDNDYYYYALPLLGWGIKRRCCLTSVCLTSVCRLHRA